MGKSPIGIQLIIENNRSCTRKYNIPMSPLPLSTCTKVNSCLPPLRQEAVLLYRLVDFQYLSTPSLDLCWNGISKVTLRAG